MQKLNSSTYLLVFLSLIFILPGCASMRMLKGHKAEISRLAYSDIPPEQKMDGLGDVMVAVLDESTQFVNPKKTYKYAQSFLDQNEKELNILYNDLDAWQSGLKGGQKVKFGARLLTKSYTRKLVTLVPKFKKRVEHRYKTMVFMTKILGLFKLKKMLKK